MQHEGFPEDALAAALELPGVRTELRHSHDAWSVLPSSNPQAIVTQLLAGEGRADIHLTSGPNERLVIGLKPWAPHSAEQLERYVKGHPGASVSAITRWSVPYAVPGVLPMTTWGELRALTWPEEPPVWRQLHHLIDAVGAATPNLDPGALPVLVPA